MGVLGDVGLVGDDDDGVAFGLEFIKEGHDLDAGLGVEVAGGLVGQDDGWLIDQRAGNGDALALAAGELVRLVVHPGFEVDVAQGFSGAFQSFRGRSAVVDERQFDVMQGGGAGQQVEGLEDEADFLVADTGKLVVVQGADQLVVEPVIALGGRVEAADQVHESGLAGSGGSHDGYIFVGLDLERDAAQSADLLLGAHVVGLPQVLDYDHVALGRSAGGGLDGGHGVGCHPDASFSVYFAMRLRLGG